MTSTSAASSRGTDFALAAVLCLLGLVCYGNSLRGPFILDDHGNILDNPAIESFWPTADEARLASRRPIGHLSLALNYALARKLTGNGLDVRAFHAVNLIIHLLAALLLLGLVRRTLQRPPLQARYGRAASCLAFAVASIWLVHPLQTSSVTYVIQRLESLMGMFYLLCLYGLLRGTESSRGKAWAWYLVAVAAFWLGLGAKEVMATAVVVVPLYDRVFLSDSWRTVARRHAGVYLAMVPALVWFAVVLAPALSPHSGLTTGFGVRSVTPLEYLCSQAGVLLYYLRLAFWPYPLCLDYAWPVARTTAQIVLPGLVIVGLLVLSLVALLRWPRIGFLGVSFFVILSPTSSFVPIQELAFEYRMYLPLAPLVVLVVLGTYHGSRRVVAKLLDTDRRGKRQARRRRERQARLRQWVPGVLLVMTLAVLSYLTIQRNQDYRSAQAIWEDTASKRPANARAHVNLGNVYLGQAQTRARAGDVRGSQHAYQAAIESYGGAIQANPDYATAYNNRGRVYSELGKYDLALRDFDKAIEIDPEQVRAYHNRGTAYMDLHRYDRAIADLTKAIELQPGKADSYFSRGTAHLQLGELDAAVQDLTEAIRRQPRLADAYMNRGSALLKLRRYDEAIADLTEAIELQPTLAAAYSNRALCYYFTRQYSRARRDVQRIQQLGRPVDPRLLKLLRNVGA